MGMMEISIYQSGRQKLGKVIFQLYCGSCFVEFQVRYFSINNFSLSLSLLCVSLLSLCLVFALVFFLCMCWSRNVLVRR